MAGYVETFFIVYRKLITDIDVIIIISGLPQSLSIGYLL